MQQTENVVYKEIDVIRNYQYRLDINKYAIRYIEEMFFQEKKFWNQLINCEKELYNDFANEQDEEKKKIIKKNLNFSMAAKGNEVLACMRNWISNPKSPFHSPYMNLVPAASYSILADRFQTSINRFVKEKKKNKQSPISKPKYKKRMDSICFVLLPPDKQGNICGKGIKIILNGNSKYPVLQIGTRNHTHPLFQKNPETGDKYCYAKIREYERKPFPIHGNLKQLTIKKDIDIYYVTITVKETIRYVSERTDKSNVGIDFSVKDTQFLVLSDGTIRTNPKFLKKSMNRLKTLSKNYSKIRKKPNKSNNEKKKCIELKKFHRKVRNQRKNFLCEEAKFLEQNYNIVAMEDLAPQFMLEKSEDIQNRQQWEQRRDKVVRKSGYDIGIYSFKERAHNKLLDRCIFVPARNTSKTCSQCGTINPNMHINIKVFRCINAECGHRMDRDLNAAHNMLNYYEQHTTV